MCVCVCVSVCLCLPVRNRYPAEVQQLLRRAYYASVSFTDWNIGQLLGSLRASGA
eukprot:COSAG03_NODE_8787_length_771_cov_2.273810_1_plen_54_part_10